MSLGEGKFYYKASNPFINIGSSNTIKLFAGTSANFTQELKQI